MPADPSTSALYQLFETEWEYRMRENPLSATFCGDQRFNDRMPAMDEASLAGRVEQARQFLGQLHAIDRSLLAAGDQLNYDIFGRELEMQIQEFDFGLQYMPISRLSGFQIYLPDLSLQTPFDTLADYEAYLQRLQGFGTYFSDHIHLMRRGIELGLLPSRTALSGVEKTISGQITADPAASLFYQPFVQLPPAFTPQDQARLRQAARQAITETVVPAYQALLDFVEQEYLPAARTAIAAASLPNGAAYYAYCVRRYTTLAVSPSEVHEIGMDEVQRIRGEMDTLIRQTGFSGGFKDFLQFLRTDPRFYVDTPETLMKEVAWIMKRMEGELPRLFKKLPRTPFGMRQIPDYLAPTSTSAYYFPLSGDGKTAGFYYVNTYDLKSRPLYEYEALSFHEAVPGHHLQLALQTEMESVPNFRRFTDVTAFIEGWALYAERLGLEVGFYQDPYSNFGRLTYEIWRACRLVVDTGMHALGWSRQQAIDFMAENSGLSLLNIANEVDRYIAWPGQALAYKMGELKIRELRQFAEQTLGERFDIREFHAQLLQNGSIPLDALEERIRAWANN